MHLRRFIGLATAFVATALLGGFGCGGSGTSGAGFRGNLIGSLPTGQTIRKSDFQAVLNLTYFELGLGTAPTAQYDVQFYPVSYTTIDVKGNLTTATGLFARPVGVSNPDLVTYQHSTQTDRNVVPSAATTNTSNWEANPEPVAIMAIFASVTGKAVSAADYLGLGGNTAAIHPYVHAKSEASAGIDMARAARRLADQTGMPLSSRTFVNGYSQGGHAGMALAQEMQANSGEFSVVAAALGSGPYDLTGTQVPFALSQSTLGAQQDASLFLSYAILAYNNAYSLGIFNTAIFQTAWQPIVPPLFNMTVPLDTVGVAITASPQNTFQASMIASATTPGTPLAARLAENDLYNWKPNFPMRLYYSTADMEVSNQNSIKAATTMAGLGANVTAVPVGALSHIATFVPATAAAAVYFGTF